MSLFRPCFGLLLLHAARSQNLSIFEIEKDGLCLSIKTKTKAQLQITACGPGGGAWQYNESVLMNNHSYQYLAAWKPASENNTAACVPQEIWTGWDPTLGFTFNNGTLPNVACKGMCLGLGDMGVDAAFLPCSDPKAHGFSTRPVSDTPLAKNFTLKHGENCLNADLDSWNLTLGSCDGESALWQEDLAHAPPHDLSLHPAQFTPEICLYYWGTTECEGKDDPLLGKGCNRWGFNYDAENGVIRDDLCPDYCVLVNSTNGLNTDNCTDVEGFKWTRTYV